MFCQVLTLCDFSGQYGKGVNMKAMKPSDKMPFDQQWNWELTILILSLRYLASFICS